MIDWEAIEREYRADQLSIREIARSHGISDTAVRKRAVSKGWTRNLGKQVRSRIQERLVTDDVGDVRSDRNAKLAVENAAARGVEIVRRHRAAVGRAAKLVDMLIDELSVETVESEQMRADETAKEKPDKRLLHALSLPGRAQSARQLAAATRELILLERQAYSLDDKSDDKPADHIPVEERLKAYRREQQVDDSPNVARLNDKRSA
jgi:hypothetical protein